MSEAAAPIEELVTEMPNAGVWQHLQRAWSLDLRSLALFRVALACMLLVDLIARATELREFYTDFGVLPRATWHMLRPSGFWSLHALFGSAWMQAILFLLAAAFALMLLAGWHTRIASIASWLMLLSVENRIPGVESHGDILLRVLLFWAMFLPLGARWSIDGARSGFVRDAAGEDEFALLTPASLALMLQIALIFAFGYLWKSSPEWKSGRAMLYALNMETWATTSGRGMLHFPSALTFISRYVLLADLLTPLLIFFPWKYQRVRTWSVVVVIMLQVLLAMILRLGLYPFLLMTALLSLLPAWYWQSQERSAHFSDQIEWALAERFPPLPVSVRTHRLVGYATSAVVVLAFIFIFLWNVKGLRNLQPGPGMQRIANLFRLDQKWDLLAPYPYQEEGWYVAPAQLKDGSQIDLFRRGASVRWYKPSQDAVFRQAASQHELEFFERLHTTQFAAYRPLYAQYLCREWNRAHPDQHVENVEVDFMRRINLFEHGTYALVRKYPLAKEPCQ